MTDFKVGDRVMRKRISRETNPLAVGEVTAASERFVTVKWPVWNARNKCWTKHKIRCDARAVMLFDGKEYARRYEIVVKAAQEDFGNRLMAAWDTPNAD